MSPRFDDAQRFAPHPDAAGRALEREAILVQLATGATYRLNDSGRRLWGWATEGETVGEIAHRLAETYELDPETARRDAEAVLEELLADQLIVPFIAREATPR